MVVSIKLLVAMGSSSVGATASSTVREMLKKMPRVRYLNVIVDHTDSTGIRIGLIAGKCALFWPQITLIWREIALIRLRIDPVSHPVALFLCKSARG